MARKKWKRELDRLLEIFEIESTISLSKINHHFEGLGRPFDDKFREYFLDESTQRLDTSFDIVQFDGCSKTPIEMAPNTSASKQVAHIYKQVKMISNAFSESNNNAENFEKEHIDTHLNTKRMVKAFEKCELDRLLETFELESTVSLSKINYYFEELGRPFDDTFREYFLDKSTQRLNTSFDIVQFDGCSKTPIQPIQKSSASKQAANGPKKAQIRSRASQKSISNTDLGIENFVKTSVKCELNVRNEVKHHPKNISDSIGGKREFNVTSKKEFNLKNVSHKNTREKNDRARDPERTKVSRIQPSINSIIKLFNFKCEDCDYATNNRGHLNSHQRIHDFQKLYGVVQDPITKLFKCPNCNNQYLKWFNLKSHLISHWNNRASYKCQHCLRPFDDEIKRDRHETRCTGHRFECYLCKYYATSYLSDMQEHMRTHAGGKPIQCTVCNMCFRHKATLRSHMKSKHKDASKQNQ